MTSTAFATAPHRSRGLRIGSVIVRPVGSPRVRLARIGLVMAVMVGALVIAGVVAPRADAESSLSGADAAVSHTSTYVVAPGETLWSIAQEFTGPGESVRDTVAAIKELNAMDSASLGVGDQLEVPGSH